ncbi:hypothetical protein [Chitinophaga caseinilytica]|uniref:Glycosyl transferase family 25 n=1 Tax=Chitinophaga caseinilytica TaxID=2267521 RepID=A0ABZ2Z8N4_9BACT
MNQDVKTPFPPIPAFIINLKKRDDRRQHALAQFAGKPEFTPVIVEAREHASGAVGLWDTILEILSSRAEQASEYVLICEDDHLFTENYSPELLHTCIIEARERQADILVGGPSWFENAFHASDNLFWVEKFTGFQFVVVFRKFIPQILEADFGTGNVADLFISRLTDAKFFIAPFVSVQQSFGYSDVTSRNDTPGRVDELYVNAIAKVNILDTVAGFFRNAAVQPEVAGTIDLATVVLPVYILSTPGAADKEGQILKEFEGRREFTIATHEWSACDNTADWGRLCSIVRMAVEKEEDVIVVCYDDHRFTPAYSAHTFVRQVIRAYQYGGGLLCGSINGFSQVLPLADDGFWTDQVTGSRFIVIYHSAFQAILDEAFNPELTLEAMLSEMISNKMVVYPFISLQENSPEEKPEAKGGSPAGRDKYETCRQRLEKANKASQVYGSPVRRAV